MSAASGPSPKPGVLSNLSPIACEPVSVGGKASAHGGLILSAETGRGRGASRAYWRLKFAGNPVSVRLSRGDHLRFRVAGGYVGFGRVGGGGRSPAKPVSVVRRSEFRTYYRLTPASAHE